MYTYIYTYICICMYVCIYIYIYANATEYVVTAFTIFHVLADMFVAVESVIRLSYSELIKCFSRF
jgi:hypothetical protein